MTLEKVTSRKCGAEVGCLKGDRLIVPVILSTAILAIICTCANELAATCFAIYYCQETKVDTLVEWFERYRMIGQMAIILNGFCSFAMGTYVAATRQLRLIALAPMFGFTIIGLLAQQALGLAAQYYDYQRMLQLESVIIKIGMILMVPVTLSLVIRLIRVLLKNLSAVAR